MLELYNDLHIRTYNNTDFEIYQHFLNTQQIQMYYKLLSYQLYVIALLEYYQFSGALEQKLLCL